VLSISACEGVVAYNPDNPDGPDNPDPGETPATSPLQGEGWTGSTSLTDYPKTADTTTCGEGCVIVDLGTDSNGSTPLARMQYALTLLSTNGRLLLENTGDAPIVMSDTEGPQFVRSTAWSSGLLDETTAMGTIGYKQVFAHGTTRIRIDASQVHFQGDTGPLVFRGGTHEHWKGFEITGEQWFKGDASPEGTCPSQINQAAGIVSLDSGSSHIRIEDFWVHDNPAGEPVYMRGRPEYHIVQDTILWRNGNAACGANSFTPNGFTGDGSHHVFARDLVFNASDDGYDFWAGSSITVLDSVSWGAGFFPGTSTQSGDGSGFKTGLCDGSKCSFYSGNNTFLGCASIYSQSYGIGVGEAGVLPMTYDQITTAQTVRVAGMWPRSTEFALHRRHGANPRNEHQQLGHQRVRCPVRRRGQRRFLAL
jgi:hypothetical protein